MSEHARAAELLDRYEQKVKRIARRLLGTDSDHDDIVQNVFFSVISHITTVRDYEKLDQWMHTVIVNTCQGEHRKRQVRRRFLDSQPPEPPLGDLTRDVEARDLLERARSLLARMPPEDRKVFVLHRAEGHTLSEVSELCGFSLATAKRRLATANRRFNKMVEREFADVLR